MYKAMFWVIFYILYGWLHENNSKLSLSHIMLLFYEMNEMYYIDFSSLTVTVASLKYKMQKTFKEKY